MTKEYFDFEELNEEIEIKDIFLDLNLIKKNIFNYSSQKLCEMIVCNRYFNLDKNISLFCMEELAKRRMNGDIFNFEDIIENNYNELPQLNFNMLDLRSILNQIVNNKMKK